MIEREASTTATTPSDWFVPPFKRWGCLKDGAPGFVVHAERPALWLVFVRVPFIGACHGYSYGSERVQDTNCGAVVG